MPKPGSTDLRLLRDAIRARWRRCRRSTGRRPAFASGALPSHPSGAARDGADRWIQAKALAAAAAVLTLVLAGCGGGSDASDGAPVSGVSINDDDGLNGVVLPKPYAAPDVTLTDATGKPYRLPADATKPLTLVFFGYTHCPDICQVVMANIASALTRLDARQRDQVQMEFVTTDPARDDVRTVHAYVQRFDPAFDGLTGDLSTIVRLGKAFDVPIEKGQRLASGGYDVAHGTQIVGLLPDGRAPFVWTEGTDPAALAEDITTILDDKVPGLDDKVPGS